MQFTVPPALEPGDQVAVIAPASGLAAAYPEVYELGLERLREVFDLDPVEYPTATADDEYLREHPEERARDVMDAFRDPDIQGVIATIGGNDQIRILEHVDPDVLAEHPTRFYGQSDNTNLAAMLWREGVVSYYGGALLTDLATYGGIPEYAERYLRRAFFEESHGALSPADEVTDKDVDWGGFPDVEADPEYEPSPGWTFRGGDAPATGRTWGGCLEVIDLLLASDRCVPSVEAGDEDLVLCLETSEELPGAGAVERTVTALGERGLLERASAVLVGRAKARSHVVDRPPEERAAYRDRQRDAVERVAARYDPDLPLVFDLEFGHTIPTAAVPLGARVTVDPREETIVFE
ncbi:S66 family peptidase [Halobacterium zhouii]|uniref:S66 family peptidase n=1 Tax=Halobacterium zhouii TaxID=2902624 RepID=UPI001E28E70A|nr:S66 peptidase family protein [Halobacterium zhouii]